MEHQDKSNPQKIMDIELTVSIQMTKVSVILPTKNVEDNIGDLLSGSLGKIVWYTSSLHPIEIVKNK